MLYLCVNICSFNLRHHLAWTREHGINNDSMFNKVGTYTLRPTLSGVSRDVGTSFVMWWFFIPPPSVIPLAYRYVKFLRIVNSLAFFVWQIATFIAAQQIADSYHPIKFYSTRGLSIPTPPCLCVWFRVLEFSSYWPLTAP